MKMNEFEKGLSKYLDASTLNKIRSVKVGIAGAGGLGSNCALNLVRCGFTQFKIVDFDVVEPSNLNRQFYFSDQIGIPKVQALKMNLTRINPDLNLEMLQQKITGENALQIFEDCDVVVEAFDRVEYKTMIVEKFYSSGKLLVSASGLAGCGNSDAIKIRKIKPDFFLIGDMISEAGLELPPLSPRVNIAAAKEADAVLEYVLNRDRPAERRAEN